MARLSQPSLDLVLLKGIVVADLGPLPIGSVITLLEQEAKDLIASGDARLATQEDTQPGKPEAPQPHLREDPSSQEGQGQGGKTQQDPEKQGKVVDAEHNPPAPPGPGEPGYTPEVEANPPAEDPPAEDPPADDPPAEDPPAEDPPADDPPADDPPAASTKAQTKKGGAAKGGKKAQT